MRIAIVLVVLLALLVPSQVQAWGPRTHYEIATRLGYPDTWTCDFRAGSVLPDFTLALRNAGYDAPNLQHVTHSWEFVDALREVASEDFVNGWIAHILSDEVESAYSRERMALGAPMSADWPVDEAYRNRSRLWMDSDKYRRWMQHGIDAMGVDYEVPDMQLICSLYHNYVNHYYGNQQLYLQVLDEWYGDHESYVDASVQAYHNHGIMYVLEPGWNMISGAVAQAAHDQGLLATAYSWCPVSKSYQSAPPFEPLRGYWVASTERQEVLE